MWCHYSAGMAGAMWNCRHLSAFCVHRKTKPLHAKAHHAISLPLTSLSHSLPPNQHPIPLDVFVGGGGGAKFCAVCVNGDLNQ